MVVIQREMRERFQKAMKRTIKAHKAMRYKLTEQKDGQADVFVTDGYVAALVRNIPSVDAHVIIEDLKGSAGYDVYEMGQGTADECAAHLFRRTGESVIDLQPTPFLVESVGKNGCSFRIFTGRSNKPHAAAIPQAAVDVAEALEIDAWHCPDETTPTAYAAGRFVDENNRAWAEVWTGMINQNALFKNFAIGAVIGEAFVRSMKQA